MIHDLLPGFFDQYADWLVSNKWNVLISINYFICLILILKIRIELISIYWEKKDLNRRFYSKWISEKEFLHLIKHIKSDGGGVG